MSSQPLKINFFVNYVDPRGSYFRYHNLAIGLQSLGHRVEVYAGDHNRHNKRRSEVRDGVQYHITPQAIGASVFGMDCVPLSIAERLFRHGRNCDVAHLFQPMPSAAAAWWRQRARLKFYDWDDQWMGGLLSAPAKCFLTRWKYGWVRRLEDGLPKSADSVTAISHYLAEMARQRGASDVTVLNSGSWPREPVDRHAVRERLGLRRDAYYAGFMGSTVGELPWCFEALESVLTTHPDVRLALCGMPERCLDGITTAVRERIDYLGKLTPSDAAAFAACIDLGLLPLADDTFNQSRLPQKFGDHAMTGVPLLCSEVGECERLGPRVPNMIPAGKTKEGWLQAFRDAVQHRCDEGVDRGAATANYREQFSWNAIAKQLSDLYASRLDAA